MDKNHYMDVVFLYQRNNAPKCWILILFWITLCWISWPIYHLGIKARAVFKSTETGQFKNAQDSVPRPPGSGEIAKRKVGHVLRDTLYFEGCISIFYLPIIHRKCRKASIQPISALIYTLRLCYNLCFLSSIAKIKLFFTPILSLNFQ